MADPLIRYQLDPTGTNVDNAVAGELHTLSAAPVARAVVPTYGPFFTDSFTIYDTVSNIPLVRGTQYQVVELLQEATLRFGKEIAQLVLIIDNSVSSTVRINYQVLGGLYQNTTDGIANLYETFLKDAREVDWTNVLNKPLAYPPSLHNHMIQDVVGFEPLVVALERIRNAVVLADVPAFEALVAWVKSRGKDVVTEQDINNVSPVDKYVTFDKLLYALERLNFNAITVNPTSGSIDHKGTFAVQLTTTNMPDNTQLYWSVLHGTTSDKDFASPNGLVNISANRGTFNFALRDNNETETEEVFRLAIRKNSVTGPILAQTGEFRTRAHQANDMHDYLNTCCIYKPTIQINATSAFIMECLG